MVKNPTTDEVLWTILPSTESAEYGTRYVQPWRGKLRNVRGIYGIAQFCSFDPETGFLSFAHNESTSLCFDNLHRTEQEAWEAYDKALDKEMLGLAQEKGVATKRIAELRRKEAEKA